jgi:hypothetical protein
VGTPTVDCQYILLEAAKRAGVQRFIPSAFGFDSDKLPWVLPLMTLTMHSIPKEAVDEPLAASLLTVIVQFVWIGCVSCAAGLGCTVSGIARGDFTKLWLTAAWITQ